MYVNTQRMKFITFGANTHTHTPIFICIATWYKSSANFIIKKQALVHYSLESCILFIIPDLNKGQIYAALERVVGADRKECNSSFHRSDFV